MIVAISRFGLGGRSQEEAAAMFGESVPRYQAVPGLISKHYFVDGEEGGGIYLFRNVEDADAFFDAAWKQAINQRFGNPPSLQYLSCPVSIDNQAGRVLKS